MFCSIGTMEERDQLHNVCAIVLDEVHYLSDISRGTVWEEVVITDFGSRVSERLCSPYTPWPVSFIHSSANV